MSSEEQAAETSSQVQEGKKPEVGLKDWLLGIPFVISFVATLMSFDLVQRVATQFGMKAHEWVNVRLNWAIVKVIGMTGAKVELIRHQDLPEAGPVIIVSNHQSLMDIPYITSLLPDLHPRFVAKKELSRWLPYVSYSLRTGGHAIIDRSNPRQALTEIKDLSEFCKERGCGLAIFPEGTRARYGGVGKLKARGVDSLLKLLPEAPVVVVTIESAWKLASYKLLPAPSGLTITIKAVSVYARHRDEDRKALIENVFADLESGVRDQL